MKTLWLFLVLGFLTAFCNGQSIGYGPHPLDASGEWQAYPLPADALIHPERVWHRLSLRLTGKTTTNNLWYFHYVGELEYYDTLLISTHPDCLTDDRSYWEYFTYSFKYDINLQMVWAPDLFTGRLVYNGSSGTGRRLPGAYPRIHALGEEIVLGAQSLTRSHLPAENAGEARLYLPVGHTRYPPGTASNFGDPCLISAIGVPTHGSSVFQRIGPVPSATQTGAIVVEVASAVPTLTEESHVVHRAAVRVYQQEDFIRSRKEAESEAAYLDYLKEVKEKRRLVAQADIAPGKKRLDFSDLNALQEAPAGGLRLARYTIEVAEGETDEWFMDRDANVHTNQFQTLHFQPVELFNVHVDQLPQSILLRPFGTLGAKKDLIEKLSAIGPFHFAPPEAQALDYLGKIERGVVALTPAIDEALRRAVWAERAVRDEALFAERMVEQILQGFANVLGDLYSDLSDFRSVEAKYAERIVNSGRKISPEAAARYKLDATDIEASRNVFGHEFAQALQTKAQIANTVQRIVKSLKPHLERQLVSQKIPETEAKWIAEAFVQALNFIFNRFQSLTTEGQFRDAIKLAIKEVVKLAKPLLMDLPGTSLGTAAGQTAEYLDFSVIQMQSWTSADEERYRDDRQKVVSIMNEMAADWQRKLSNSTKALALAGVAEASQNLTGAAGKVFKWAKVLEKVSQVSKYALNAGSTVEPLLFNYKDGPDYVRRAVYRAYGQNPPPPPEPPPALAQSSLNEAPKDEYHTAAHHAGVPSTNQISTVLLAFGDALKANDLGLAIRLYSGGSGTNCLLSMDQFLTGSRYFVEHAAHVESSGQPVAAQVAPQQQDQLLQFHNLAREFELRFATLLERVFTGVHGTTNSAAYLAERGKVLESTDRFRASIAETIRSWTYYDFAQQASKFLPLIVIEPVSITSVETGSPFISRTPESFKVIARVRNLSGSPVTNFQAILRLNAPANAVANPDEPTATRSVHLSAKDGEPGSGPDEAVLEWQLEYSGSLRPRQIEVFVEAAPSPRYASTDAFFGLAVGSELYDADNDLLEDAWEMAHGLDPTIDDAELDSDGDGLSNIQEQKMGTHPMQPDTDGDGLSDGAEAAGSNGFKTNPLAKDTDGDGVEDHLDGAPNDAGSTVANTASEEPVIGVSQNTVFLTQNQPFAFIDVKNGGRGSLVWAATVSNPDIITTSANSASRFSSDSLLISVSSSYDFAAADVAVATVAISDNSGQTFDFQKVTVIIAGRFGSVPELSAGTAAGTFNLRWAGVRGQTYQVQYSDDLAVWIDAADGTFTATNSGTLRWTDKGPPGTVSPPGEQAHRFYRVIAVPDRN